MKFDSRSPFFGLPVEEIERGAFCGGQDFGSEAGVGTAELCEIQLNFVPKRSGFPEPLPPTHSGRSPAALARHKNGGRVQSLAIQKALRDFIRLKGTVGIKDQ